MIKYWAYYVSYTDVLDNTKHLHTCIYKYHNFKYYKSHDHCKYYKSLTHSLTKYNGSTCTVILVR